MALDISLAMSFLALLATFYQAHLQRSHNEKSVKPLAQIDLLDQEGVLFVRIQNNGVGPMVVDRLIFTKGGQTSHRIQDCMDIDPKAYYHIEITDTNKKVIIPGGFLEVFSRSLDPKNDGVLIAQFQQELAALHLKVEGHDIYNIRISIEKNLKWFSRHH